MSGGHRLRRVVTGQAGAATAWALAVVTLLSTLIAIAGPREIALARDTALRQQFARLLPADTGIAVTAQWQPFGGDRQSMLTAEGLRQISAHAGAAMRRPLNSPAGQRWAGATAPAETLLNPPAQAGAHLPPLLEVAYRSSLAAHARLLSGGWPGRATATRMALACGTGRARSLRMITAGVVVTAATASRFALRVGSRIRECPYQPGDPAVSLLVTGVIQPLGPASAFWQYDPVLAAPSLLNPDKAPQWLGGVLIGAAELPAVQSAYSGSTWRGAWFFPLDLHGVTAAALPRLLSGIEAMSTASAVRGEFTFGGRFTSAPVTTSGLPAALAGYLPEQRAVTAIDSLLVVGLFVAALVLLLVCVTLAAGAHRPELALIRARGGTIAQVAARLAGRTCGVTVPAVAAGAVAAVVVAPGDGGASSWVLGGIAALTAIAGPAVAGGWAHRRAQPTPAEARDGAGADTRTRLAGLRRLAAELTVLAAAAGAVVALRGRGVGGGTDPYLSASPVLVAAAAGVAVARVYPALVRGLLAAAAARRGAVGFLALARSARSRATSMLPALTLVLTLTLTAFAAAIAGAITSGQVAASWRQTGADVVAQAPGDTPVSPAAQRAVGEAPGVTATAAVYVTADNPPLAPELVTPATGSSRASARTVALAVVDPARYAALAATTPWPRFPAALLARSRTGPHGAIPVLASPAAVAAAGRAAAHGGTALELDGIRLPVRIVGRIGATPAMPTGGRFVVMPSWAQARFPSIAGPDELLATGSGIDVRALRTALARHLRGSRLTLRSQVLATLASSPAQHAGERLYVLGLWTAGALSALAVLFGLASSARDRERLMTRLTGLGMSTRQARALALADTLPLLVVAVGGMVTAVLVLATAAAPALNLTVFTGQPAGVPVRPGVTALAVPAAAAVLLAAVAVAVERATSRRHGAGATLRRGDGS